MNRPIALVLGIVMLALWISLAVMLGDIAAKIHLSQIANQTQKTDLQIPKNMETLKKEWYENNQPKD